MTMLGGRENVFGVGSAGIGWVMIGGYSNNLGNTDGSGQAEDGPVLIGGRYNSLGASTGGGIFAGYENTQRSNTDASVIIGGKQNNLAADCQFGAIVGASNSTLNSGYCGIFGGYYNVQAGSYNCYIYGGQENNIQANSYNNNSIVGGQNNTIQAITDTNNPVGRFEPGTSIIGGRFNTISGSTHFSQIIGGNNNLMTHSGSVILGGSNITSSAHNTVYTPNLDVTGSAKITGSVYIDAATQAFAISGSLGSSEMFVIDYHTNGARFLSNRSNSVLHLGTPNKTDILSLGRNAGVGLFGDAYEPGTPYSFGSNSATWKTVDFILSGSLTVTGSVSGNVLGNDTDTYTSSPRVQQVVTLTQAEYNAIGSPNANTLYIISGSVPNATLGSNTFVGNQTITGSLTVTGGITGSISSASFASTASFVTTASFASTASYAVNSTSASYALVATTASYVNLSTINQNVTFSGSVRGIVISGSTTSNTASLDFSLGNFFTLNTNNILNTYIEPINVQPGQTVNLELTYPASASAITFPSYVKQPSGSAYSPSGANTTDVLTFIVFSNTSSVYLSNVKNLI
jgi:hypothetical protein